MHDNIYIISKFQYLIKCAVWLNYLYYLIKCAVWLNYLYYLCGAVISSPKGRKSMLKLAERMVMSFCTGVGASTAHTWTMLSGSGADDVRVMSRKSMDDPGRPPGIVLSAATSFWLPVPPNQVFDFLRNENSRNEVDNNFFNIQR